MDSSSLFHFGATVFGTWLGGLTMLPFVLKHLRNLHKRVGSLEAQLGVEPTTPAPSMEPSFSDFLPQRRRQ